MKRFIVLFLVFGMVLASVVSAAPATITLVSRPGVTAYGPRVGDRVDPPGMPTFAPGADGWGDPKLAVVAHTGTWDPAPTPAVYISTAEHAEMLGYHTWRWFRDELKLACTAYNIQAGVTLAANADDAEWFYLNGAFIGSNGVYNNFVNYTIAPVAGTNTLDFITRNNQFGTTTGNPTGLAYKTTVNYSVADVIWLPPVTLENFDLLDGSTLPLKFQLFQGGTLLTAAQDVYMRVLDAGGATVAEWVPGEGTDFLRFDGTEFYYIGNFHTKDYTLAEATYTAVVYDNCTDGVLGSINFNVVPSQSRGGKK